MQPDTIESLNHSTIQHGKYNDRIYVMKIAPEDVATLPAELHELAKAQGYSKIFAKVPAHQTQPFLDHGFQREAEIPQFFNGKDTAVFLGCFLNEGRKASLTPVRNEEVLAACRQKQSQATKVSLPGDASLRICNPADTETMAELYHEVFPSYPFPIEDPAYLRETMATHIVYFGVWWKGRLVALSSAEMDDSAGNVEMTDFATLPAFRGKALATVLLAAMEQEMRRRKIVTAYTISRAPSFGMNITFARMGYQFGGRLINNTHIGGQFEDMNVWHKTLMDDPYSRA